MSKEYSPVNAGVVKEFLDSDDWVYEFIEEDGLFRFGLTLDGPVKKADFIVDVQENCVITYALLNNIGADASDPAMMREMADFICKANYGLKNGNFEFDIKDGEIRFKSYIDCEGTAPSIAAVRNSISCCAVMLNIYSQGITGIIFGGLDADTAIAKCENNGSMN